MITPRQHATRARAATLQPEARAAVQGDPGAVLLRLRPRPADRRVRRRDGPLGRSPGLHDDRAAAGSGSPQSAIRETLTERERPGGSGDLDRPGDRRDPGDDRRRPGPKPNNQFNLLSQARRQPGSTFKTFVLAAAIEQGIDPDSTYYVSAPFTYEPDDKGNCDDGTWWCVKTYDSSYYGWTSIERATLRSDNAVYAQLTLDVTPERVGRDGANGSVSARRSTSTASSCRRWGSARSRSPRSTWRPPTRRSPPAACYSEPMAIRKVVLPNGKEDTTAGWGEPKRSARDPGRRRRQS